MKERFNNLSPYSRTIILLFLILDIVFSILYPITLSREGYLYQNTLMVPKEIDGDTIYSGKINGVSVSFLVHADNTLDYTYGTKTYGPYSISEYAADTEATLPEDSAIFLQVMRKEEILYRGPVYTVGTQYSLPQSDDVFMEVTSLIEIPYKAYANSKEPPLDVVIELLHGPSLTHKGYICFWGFGLAISLLAILSLLFADELFHLNMLFHIRNAEDAEPSNLELANRNITATSLFLLTAVLFVIGFNLT